MKRLAICFTLLLCSACSSGSVQQSLGLGRSAPDEFRVVSQPPLTIPPDFYLYPPDKARARSSNQGGPRSARDILANQGRSFIDKHYTEKATTAQSGNVNTATPAVEATNLPDAAQQQIVSMLGGGEADPDIRETLRSEEQSRQQDGNNQGLFDALITSPIKEPGEPIVDPAKERQRLIENKQRGAKPNQGEIPTKTDTPSLLDEWF